MRHLRCLKKKSEQVEKWNRHVTKKKKANDQRKTEKSSIIIRHGYWVVSLNYKAGDLNGFSHDITVKDFFEL